jgi:hypothetical protein
MNCSISHRPNPAHNEQVSEEISKEMRGKGRVANVAASAVHSRRVVWRWKPAGKEGGMSRILLVM